MTQFKAYQEGVYVNGQTILSVANGMGKFKDMGLDILSDNDLSDLSRDKWYPKQAWLNAFKDIAEEIGEATLFNIGKAIPESADFPPEIDTIEKGLQSIDVAYHSNHSKDGKNPMFNPATGEKQSGIGNYIFESTGSNSAVIVGNTPYPCDFDRGIITAIAHKFKPTAEVKLDPGKPGKKDGEKQSTYLISW